MYQVPELTGTQRLGRQDVGLASSSPGPEPFPPHPHQPSASTVPPVSTRGQHGLHPKCHIPSQPSGKELRTFPSGPLSTPTVAGLWSQFYRREYEALDGEVTQVTRGNSGIQTSPQNLCCHTPCCPVPYYFPRVLRSPGLSATHGQKG